MVEIVNLRSIRKRKARAENARKADENRVIHGRSTSEKLLQKAQAERTTALLDGHRREYDSPLRPSKSIRDGDE